MPVSKVCPQCEKTFHVKPSWASQQCCSRACRVAYEAIHGRAAAQAVPIKFTCKQCGGPFEMKPAYLSVYRKKFGKDPMYCSIPCSAKGRRADTEARSTFVCENCGKTNQMKRYEGTGRTVYYRQQRYCGQTCKVEGQMKAAHERFKGGDYGRHVKRNGYVWISVPALANGGVKREMLEHRHVMEQQLGRKLLPEETVHHKDGNRQNNTPENLELFTSRHGPGHRVTDRVANAIETLRLYPDFAARAGVALVDVGGEAHAQVTPPARSEPPAASG